MPLLARILYSASHWRCGGQALAAWPATVWSTHGMATCYIFTMWPSLGHHCVSYSWFECQRRRQCGDPALARPSLLGVCANIDISSPFYDRLPWEKVARTNPTTTKAQTNIAVSHCTASPVSAAAMAANAERWWWQVIAPFLQFGPSDKLHGSEGCCQPYIEIC